MNHAPLRMHYLQHVPFEGTAHIGTWAKEKGHSLSCTRLYAGEALPDLDAFDWLLAMGGPMNIYEHTAYPWLEAEKTFIAQAVKAGKLFLGVCLGAQLLADALGGEVMANDEKEIGWLPIQITEAGRACGLFQDWPDAPMVFHWHGDTFQLPPGCTSLVKSEACANQAFLYKGRALGLQFHTEYTSDSIEDMLHHCGEELAQSGAYIQTAAHIRENMHNTLITSQFLEFLLDALSASGRMEI
jgi:GMP synthase-like glutamine amidotransferase